MANTLSEHLPATGKRAFRNGRNEPIAIRKGFNGGAHKDRNRS